MSDNLQEDLKKVKLKIADLEKLKVGDPGYEAAQNRLLGLQEEKNILLKAHYGAGTSTSGGPVVRKHPKLYFDDHSIEDAFERMSRVMYQGKSIGSVSRITAEGLCVGANHVHVDENGNFLDVTAFDGWQLRLLASFPYHDIIFLQGPQGPAFEWTTDVLFAPPQKIMFLAHPSAPEQDLIKTERPHETHGRITLMAASLEIAAADYHGAMPASSGGTVLFNSKQFAGVHLGTSYHKDDVYYQDEEDQGAPEGRIDKDPKKMWPQGSDEGQGGAKKRRVSAAPADGQVLERLQKLTMHSIANIKHKDQVSLFVPAPFVAALARRAGLVGTHPLHQPFSRLSNRSQ